ncbi:hypothetical protein F7734_10500 [Scytonema sp. UIC 10036]|uniref:WD40 domain-containing protein n=1 Tax=Scytonema sp. UIC 10036 TaxID=2304196 RepID=UPI0012DA9AB3|nr:NB-ARC domain-containing protein [Scytonema sp. UIC 10036]MUG92856.1 hypothetical protein [Scytonema sp. UIC 10036]
MNFEEALEVADEAAFVNVGRRLSQVEIAILKGSWENLTYEQIASEARYSVAYVKQHVGPELWKLLTQALGEKVSKSNFRSALERFWRKSKSAEGGEKTSENSIQNSNPPFSPLGKGGLKGDAPLAQEVFHRGADWGEQIDVSMFYGRTAELNILEQWLINDRCRLVALLGMGGIGKTSIAAKLAQQIQGSFEYVIWRSLHNSPPLFEILATLIQFFSNLEVSENDLPKSVNSRISQLIEYLLKHRCLIVLDNTETILRSGDRAGFYREGYEDYGLLIKRVGQEIHQSCLILTSREKPKEVASLEGQALSVRSLQLGGVEAVAGQKILEVKGLGGSKSELTTLVEHYAGNVLALKIVATTILDLFNGDVSEFLRQETAVFGSIHELLDQQFSRLSDLEKDIMYWLAINREPISLSELREDIVSRIPLQKLLDALESLVQRSLLEKATLIKNPLSLFTLQPVLMEYVTNQLVEQVCQEIATQNIKLFRSHALIKTTAKDYVRQTQIRLILQPVIDGLLTDLRSKKDMAKNLTQIITKLRKESPLEPGYTGGNVFNLLKQLETDLSGYDFSYLNISQADLRCVELHNVNFAHANLAKLAFVESFGAILSVTFSPNGKLLAAGDTNGEIHLYQVADGQQLLICKGHKGWVWSVCFSPDGKTLVSGSEDQTIKLWDTSNGYCLRNLEGHSGTVFSVAFSPDGHILASGSEDHTVKLWNVSTGQVYKNLTGHTNWVFSVVFSPDGYTLASGSHDSTIKLWDTSTAQLLKTLHGHTKRVQSVAYSLKNSHILASASDDHTVKLWDISTGECLKTLPGHSSGLWSIAFSPDGQVLASSSNDQTVRLWDCRTDQCFRILADHSNRVLSVAFSPQGTILASGTFDQEIKIWEVKSGHCLKTIQGYANWVFSVGFSPQGTKLASGTNDGKVRLWNSSTGKCFRTLKGHSNKVWSITFSPDRNILASSSDDQTVKLWNISTGQCFKTLRGHTGGVLSVAFSPTSQVLASGGEDQAVKLWDISTGQSFKILQGHSNRIFTVAFSVDDRILASGSDDHTVKLWDIHTGQCLKTLQGHTNRIYSIAFSPNGFILASASEDKTLKLWDIRTGECLKTLQGHAGWVRSVAFSPDSQVLASSSDDYTVRLWYVSTGECLKILQGHTGWVWSVTFSPKGDAIASGSHDGSIKLWDVLTGDCVQTLRDKRPYEGMNITGVTGLNEATVETLKALGAVESYPSGSPQ